MVYRICHHHNEEVIGFAEIKKKLVEQDLQKEKRRKAVDDLDEQPPPKKIADEKFNSGHQLIGVNTDNNPLGQRGPEENSEREAHENARNDDVTPPALWAPTED